MPAVFALTIVTGEMHEQVHIDAGCLLCGGYGERDFNVWRTAENYASDLTLPATARH